MAKLKLFVGSSVSGLEYARAIQRNLNFDAWIRVWSEGIFRTSSYPVDDLIAALDDNLPEDVLITNGRDGAATKAVRDNVLFKLEMFIGRLGRSFHN
jgi:predicted nucleotide-binding protein